MHPAEILSIALVEQERALGIVAGLRTAPVALSRATTLLGSFTVDRRTGHSVIRLSRHLVDADQVRDTMRHELAHQAAHELHGHLGHGPPWQMWASYLGCVPAPCSRDGLDPDAVRARQRYAVSCRACGLRTTRQRLSKLVRQPWRYVCSRCGGSLVREALVTGADAGGASNPR